MAKAKTNPPASTKKPASAVAAGAEAAAAAALATASEAPAESGASAPDTPPATASAPAPDTTQEHAGAGETQGFNGLRITAAREGFRRAGRAWSKQPIEIPLAGLSDAEIKLLKDEHGHMLTVEEITLP